MGVEQYHDSPFLHSVCSSVFITVWKEERTEICYLQISVPCHGLIWRLTKIKESIFGPPLYRVFTRNVCFHCTQGVRCHLYNMLTMRYKRWFVRINHQCMQSVIKKLVTRIPWQEHRLCTWRTAVTARSPFVVFLWIPLLLNLQLCGRHPSLVWTCGVSLVGTDKFSYLLLLGDGYIRASTLGQ